jgi:hypothetical protein
MNENPDSFQEFINLPESVSGHQVRSKLQQNESVLSHKQKNPFFQEREKTLTEMNDYNSHQVTFNNLSKNF